MLPKENVYLLFIDMKWLLSIVVKVNPCFYAVIWGDWREEIIQVTSDQTELRLFTTWYPTDYKFPYLMSDHVYEMSALNQNIGYNQPTQLGYYLGSDLYKK